tara:strand:+ start:158 stop:370 length:213 start_codon:yes stop_codon:yes gene_type:complete
MLKLTHEQHTEYIQWARDNYHQKVGISGKVKAMWHPTVRCEMKRLRLKQMQCIKSIVKAMDAAKLKVCYE